MKKPIKIAPKVIVVMPAYNAEKTVSQTVKDIPAGVVNEIILVDDQSHDDTVKVAKNLGLVVYVHQRNRGYGGKQKSCYKKALEHDADIVVMVHPDYQYDSSLVGQMVKPLANGSKDVMFGSRIRTRREALDGGMPLIKYLLNRMFCVIENIILGVNFSEHFSGFRAYTRQVLETLPIDNFSDDFIFDQQLMISGLGYGFRIGEIPVPVRYFSAASSIRFLKGSRFLLQTLLTLCQYILYKLKIMKSSIFIYRVDWIKAP